MLAAPPPPPPAQAASQPAAPPACRIDQLSLGFDREGDAFNGMSHAGALLVIRNLGGDCRLPGLPTLTFADGRGRPLPIARQAPRGMHPGPVVVPLGLAGNAEATAPLLWTSSPVYDPGRCLAPARVTVRIGVGALSAAWTGGRLCGPATGPATFEQPPLRLDPRIGEAR